MEKELSEIDQFKYMMYNGKLPKGKVTPLIKDIYEFMNDPVKMMEVKELKIERQLIEAKLKRNRKEGVAKSVKILIQSLYGEVDTSWVDECNEGQLMKALTITRNNFTYEQFQDEMMKGI